MVSGTYIVTDENEIKLLKAFKQVLEHGFGMVLVKMHETRNEKTKIEIEYTLTQVSFVPKDKPYKREDLL